MKILALDSTAKTATVAICEDERLITVYSVTAGLNHSETLLPMVENVIKTAHISVDDIDMFAISDGPGSFTGVRIGVSLLKGLAFGKEKLCVGVSTIEALAYNLKDFDGIICGDGYDLAVNNMNISFASTPALLREQNAYSVALAALKKYKEDPKRDYTDRSIKPTYLRVPQAERERLERLNNGQK